MRPYSGYIMNKQIVYNSIDEIWKNIGDKELSVGEYDQTGKPKDIGLVLIPDKPTYIGSYKILSPTLLSNWARKNPDKVHHDEPSECEKLEKFMELMRIHEENLRRSKSKTSKQDEKTNPKHDRSSSPDITKSRQSGVDSTKNEIQSNDIKKKTKTKTHRRCIIESSSDESDCCEIIGTTPGRNTIKKDADRPSTSPESPVRKIRRKTTVKKRHLKTSPSPSPSQSPASRGPTELKKKKQADDKPIETILNLSDDSSSIMLDTPPADQPSVGTEFIGPESDLQETNHVDQFLVSLRSISPDTTNQLKHDFSNSSESRKDDAINDDISDQQSLSLELGQSSNLDESSSFKDDCLSVAHSNQENNPPKPRCEFIDNTVEIHVIEDEFAQYKGDDAWFEPKMPIAKIKQQTTEAMQQNRTQMPNNHNNNCNLNPFSNTNDYRSNNNRGNQTNGSNNPSNHVTKPDGRISPLVAVQNSQPEPPKPPAPVAPPIEEKPNWADTLKKFSEDKLHIVYKDLYHFRKFIKDEPKIKDLPKQLMFKYMIKDEMLYLGDLMKLICELQIYQADIEFWSELIGRFKRKLNQIGGNLTYKSSTNPEAIQGIHNKYLEAMRKFSDHAKKTNLKLTIATNDMEFLFNPDKYLDKQKREALSILPQDDQISYQPQEQPQQTPQQTPQPPPPQPSQPQPQPQLPQQQMPAILISQLQQPTIHYLPEQQPQILTDMYQQQVPSMQPQYQQQCPIQQSPLIQQKQPYTNQQHYPLQPQLEQQYQQQTLQHLQQQLQQPFHVFQQVPDPPPQQQLQRKVEVINKGKFTGRLDFKIIAPPRRA